MLLPQSVGKTLTLYIEGILVILLLGVCVTIKRYSLDFLPGDLVYFAFSVNQWIKAHLNFLLVTLILFSVLTPFVVRSRDFFLFLSRVFIPISVVLIAGIVVFNFAWKKTLQTNLNKSDAPNVLLLTVDTMRADHLGLYGYKRNTSPTIDQFGKENVTFTSAVCQWPKTSQSFASMLTGTYFYQTGIPINVATRLPAKNLLMSEIFSNAGYKTAAFQSNANLAKYFDFDSGFDTYEELWHKQSGPAREMGWFRSDLVVNRTIDWIKKNRGKRFFVWTHIVDPHAPYTPPAPYNSMFVNDGLGNDYAPVPLGKISEHARLGDHNDPDYYVSQYDGEIRFTDDQIGKLFQALKNFGLDKNTIVIFTSDHGESFGNHDFFFDHGKYPFEDCAHVPLIIRDPKHLSKSAIVQTPVSLIDILPTVLSLANISVTNAPFQGQNLTSGQFQYQFIESGDSEKYQRTVRDKEWKLVFAPDPTDQKALGIGPFALYHFTEDKKEIRNVIDKFPAEANRLKDKLVNWLDEGLKKNRSNDRGAKQFENADIDKTSLEQLKSFGYL
ncbi:MAG: sulfatase [Candidatus Omnitrophica bacterium]|nr:sulfatase [Candidatus Omnitrophota bacterium]